MTVNHRVVLKNILGGKVIIHPEKVLMGAGQKVELRAIANEDTYFKAWEIQQDGKFIDISEEKKKSAEINLTMPDSGYGKTFYIDATFESKFIEKEADPNDFVRAILRSKTRESVGHKYQYHYELQLFNLKEFAINIKVPLTSKIIDGGKKVPQKKWGGSVNGVKGITLEANGFCEILMVYLESFEPEEELLIEVNLINLEISLNLKFRAPRYSGARSWVQYYRLINCQATSVGSKDKPKTNNGEWLRLLDRVDALESSLANALSRLTILEQQPSTHRINSSDNYLVQNSFDDVMDWLLSKDTVALSDLIDHLLPLNLLVGAVIADLNEKALDQTGELALNEDSKQIIVNRAILKKVLSKI